MPIPELQLETWSHQGAVATASQTYASVQAALAQIQWPQGAAPAVYLQGSYRNNTNIYSESDVDVVVEIGGGVFHADLSALDQSQVASQLAAYTGAVQYGWDAGYQDTVTGLRNYFGQAAVTLGSKAIRVNTPYRTADVVVAVEHRRYLRFHTFLDELYVPGIAIRIPSENRWISNYPKLHYDNGVAKNSNTHDRFKPTVRMFKNAAIGAVERGLLASVPPSYASECLVYSAPNHLFVEQHQQRFLYILAWIANNYAGIKRVSEQGAYIGNASDQWSLADAQAYVTALLALWDQF